MDEAAKWSHDLKMNASKYVDELVNETEYRVAKSLNEIQKLQDSLKAAAKNSSQAQKRADRQRRAQGSAVTSKRPATMPTAARMSGTMRSQTSFIACRIREKARGKHETEQSEHLR